MSQPNQAAEYESSQKQFESERQHLYQSGLLAGTVMVAFMFFLRTFTATETLAELVADTILRLMPAALFSFMLEFLRGWAKPVLLGSIMLGMIAIGGMIGRWADGPALDISLFTRVRKLLLLALGLWIPFAIFSLLVLQFTSSVTLTMSDILALGTVLAADFIVFSLAHFLLFPVISGTVLKRLLPDVVDEPPENTSRRELIGQSVGGVIALGSLLYLGDFLLGIRAGKSGADNGEISDPITANGDFYTVSKNFIDPGVGSDGWQLDIGGMVEQEIHISYEQLMTLPQVEQQATLTCISNKIGGDLIDNTIWTGVRLSDILDMSGVVGSPQRIAFFGDDGYSDSFEFSKGLEPTTIVAYLMNGEPLPKKHGFPARLIVPGKYGIKNGKWLQRIELVGDFSGYWQHRGWTNEGTVKTMSTFEKPNSHAVLAGNSIELGGVAFAGDRGISKVEYSTDDGDTWREVDDLNVVGPISWTIWRVFWTPDGSGSYKLQVRATDGDGAVQTSHHTDPAPDGASGYHKIIIGIA